VVFGKLISAGYHTTPNEFVSGFSDVSFGGKSTRNNTDDDFPIPVLFRTQCIDGPTTESAIPPKVVVEEEDQSKEATGCRKSKAISREMAQRPGMVMTQVS
jgi:hypothetical protein